MNLSGLRKLYVEKKQVRIVYEIVNNILKVVGIVQKSVSIG